MRDTVAKIRLWHSGKRSRRWKRNLWKFSLWNIFALNPKTKMRKTTSTLQRMMRLSGVPFTSLVGDLLCIELDQVNNDTIIWLIANERIICIDVDMIIDGGSSVLDIKSAIGSACVDAAWRKNIDVEVRLIGFFLCSEITTFGRYYTGQ